MKYTKVSTEELQILNDEVLFRSLRQYREALKVIDGHDLEMASKFAEIVELYEAERRGLEV